MKAWVCDGLDIAWLPPVRGVALLEGRVFGDVRVFGQELPGKRWLVWATQTTIEKLVEASPKGGRAVLVNEARKEGETLPAGLPALSGESVESGAMADTKIEVADAQGTPKLAADRKIGIASEGGKLVKPVYSKDKPKEAAVDK